MRKRNVQILFRLTEEEAEYLCSLAERSGHSRQALLQSMVMLYRENYILKLLALKIWM